MLAYHIVAIPTFVTGVLMQMEKKTMKGENWCTCSSDYNSANACGLYTYGVLPLYFHPLSVFVYRLTPGFINSLFPMFLRQPRPLPQLPHIHNLPCFVAHTLLFSVAHRCPSAVCLPLQSSLATGRKEQMVGSTELDTRALSHPVTSSAEPADREARRVV